MTSETNPGLETAATPRAQLEALLAGVVRLGAASVCLMAGHAPLVRVQGALVQTGEPPLSAHAIEDLCRSFLYGDHWRQLRLGQEVRVLYNTASGDRFRTTVHRLDSGLKVSFVRLPQEIPNFETLGIPELVSSFVEFRSGLVVLTGWRGSGKSTTLASMVNRLNQSFAGHIMTLEQPIEHVYRSGAALVHQREIGVHVQSFAEGVEDAVRQGADVLVVGDLADAATLAAVLDAAERGLLVIATIHASGVVGGLYELMRLCPAAAAESVRVRLAQTLRACTSQALIRRAQTNGCVPVFEIMINNPTVQQHVRTGAFGEIPAVMERSRGLGMQVVDQGLRTLVSRNLISVDEARMHATNPESFSARGARRPLTDLGR